MVIFPLNLLKEKQSSALPSMGGPPWRQMVFVAPASAAVSASAPAPAEPQPAPPEAGRAGTFLKMLKVTNICQPGFEMLEFPKWLRQNMTKLFPDSNQHNQPLIIAKDFGCLTLGPDVPLATNEA